MTQKRPLVRYVSTAFLAVFVALGGAMATPIRPDVQKLLSQPQDAPAHYVPARAGWNGPEAARAQTAPNAALETFGSAGSARAVRAALIAAAIPDPRAVGAIVVLIFLLRMLRSASKRREKAAQETHPEAVPLRPAA